MTWWTRFETSADETKAETGNVEMENQGLEHKPIADANRTASEYSIAPKMEVDNSNNWIKSNDSEVKLVVNGMKKEAADIPHVHKERVEDTVGGEIRVLIQFDPIFYSRSLEACEKVPGDFRVWRWSLLAIPLAFMI